MFSVSVRNRNWAVDRAIKLGLNPLFYHFYLRNKQFLSSVKNVFLTFELKNAKANNELL